MLLRSGLAALSIALFLVLGALTPAAQATQFPHDGLKRIFALGNENLDIDGVDDQRVDVNVAVMDIGIDLDDPDLNAVDGLDCNGATPPSYTCESDSPDDGDVDGPPFYGWDHGTYTAKAIGAIDNNIGMVGVAPGARIWALAVAPLNTYVHHSVQTNTSTVNLSAMIAALKWVIWTRNDPDPANDIHVLTGWVGPECPPDPATRPRIICPGGITGTQSELIESLVTEAADEGVVITRASGNWAEDMGPFHIYNSLGQKNYIISSSVVDTDGLPGGLGAVGSRCGGIHDDGPTDVLDDHSNPGTGYGVGVDVAAPGSCSSSSKPWMAGAAAVLASKIKPDSRADVDAIRDTLVETGNLGWTDDSGDGIQEPLVDVSDEGEFDPDVHYAKTIRYVFYRSIDNQLREWWFSDTGEWNPIGHGPTEAMAGDPAAVVTDDGRRFVYYRGTNGQLNQRWFNDNGQSGHDGWGYAGHMAGSPTAVIGKNGRRYVFYRSADNQLREWWFSDTGEWNPIGHGPTEAMAGDPAAVVTDDGRRFVYYRGTNGQLNQRWFNDNGQSGHDGWGYAGHMVGSPAAVIGKNGRRYVFYRSADNQLREWWFSDTGEWNPIGHGPTEAMAGDPTAVVGADGRRYVYYRGTNGQLNQYWFDDNGQSGHSTWDYAGQMQGTPAASTSENGHRRWVFYRRSNGQLTDWWFRDNGEWNPTTWGYAGHMASDPAVVAALKGY